MEGISFQQTAVSLSPSLAASNRNLGWRWKIVPSLSFSILVFHPFSLSPALTLRSAGQRTDDVFFYVITRKSPLPDRGSVASPLSDVHPILITMSNQWSSGQTQEQAAGDRFKIQFARRKQAAKMLVCPPELQIGRLTDKEVVGARKRRGLERGFARI